MCVCVCMLLLLLMLYLVSVVNLCVQAVVEAAKQHRCDLSHAILREERLFCLKREQSSALVSP